MQLITVKIEKPDGANFVLGQTHFIKSVEDVHEALVGAVPGIKFELAFCEACGKCLVRWSGAEPTMIELAKKNAASSEPVTASSCSLATASTRLTC
jgi:adenosine/AMP kinase